MAYRRKKSGSTIYTESYGNGSPRKTRTSGRQKTGKTTSYSTKNGKTTLTTHMNVGGKVTRTTQTVGRTQKSKVKHTTSKVYKQPKNVNWLGMKKTKASNKPMDDMEKKLMATMFIWPLAAYFFWPIFKESFGQFAIERKRGLIRFIFVGVWLGIFEVLFCGLIFFIFLVLGTSWLSAIVSVLMDQ
jgi:hypothetical protein